MVKNKHIDMDQLIREALEENMKSCSPPLSAKESWELFQKRLQEKQKNANNKKLLKNKWIAAACVLLIIGALFWYPQNSSAINHWTDIFYKIKGSAIQLFGKVGLITDADNVSPTDEFFIYDDSEIISEQMSLVDAQKVTSFPIQIPKFIPAGFALHQVTVVRKPDGISNEINLNYIAEQRSFNITQMAVAEQFGFGMVADNEDTGVEEISINGHKANIIFYKNGITRLVWLDQTQYYSIEGELTKEEIIKIAKSL